MLYTDYNSGIIAFGYVFRMNHMRFSRFNFMTINKHISILCFVVLCIIALVEVELSSYIDKLFTDGRADRQTWIL